MTLPDAEPRLIVVPASPIARLKRADVDTARRDHRAACIRRNVEAAPVATPEQRSLLADILRPVVRPTRPS